MERQLLCIKPRDPTENDRNSGARSCRYGDRQENPRRRSARWQPLAGHLRCAIMASLQAWRMPFKLSAGRSKRPTPAKTILKSRKLEALVLMQDIFYPLRIILSSISAARAAGTSLPWYLLWIQFNPNPLRAVMAASFDVLCNHTSAPRTQDTCVKIAGPTISPAHASADVGNP